jgi:hypothetical protein
MGRQFRIYLAGESVFCCKQCGNHLAVLESIVSRVSMSLYPTSGMCLARI